MKKSAIIFTIIITVGSSCFALDFGMGGRYNARTGDTEFDMVLNELNVEARADEKSFIADLSVSYNVPPREVERLIYTVKMPPADVYMAVRVAAVIHEPVSIVVEEYNAHKGKGWGAIAKNLGIKPGSKAFHALKQDASVKLKAAKGRGKKKGKDPVTKSNKKKKHGKKK